MAFRMIHVRVFEHAHPVQLRRLYEITQLGKILFRLAGKPNNKGSPQRHPGNGLSHTLQQVQEGVAMRAPFHARQHFSACVLQGHIHVIGQPRMRRDGVQQFLRHAIGIGIEEAHPEQFFHLSQLREQLRQAVA